LPLAAPKKLEKSKKDEITPTPCVSESAVSSGICSKDSVESVVPETEEGGLPRPSIQL